MIIMGKIYLLMLIGSLYASMTFGRTMLKQIMSVVQFAVTGIELNSIDYMIVLNEITSERYPEEGEFKDFMKENFLSRGGRDQTKDQWDTPYSYKRIPKGYRITSAGPDKKTGTEDDLYLERKGNNTYINKDVQKALNASIDMVLKRDKKIAEDLKSEKLSKILKDKNLSDLGKNMNMDDIVKKIKSITSNLSDLKQSQSSGTPAEQISRDEKNQEKVRTIKCPKCGYKTTGQKPAGITVRITCPGCKAKLRVRKW